MTTACIFCGGLESNGHNLKVCSRCTANFVGISADERAEWAQGKELTIVQRKFLGVKL